MSNYSILFDLIGVLARRRYQTGERHFAALGLNHTEARLLTLLDQEKGEATQDRLSSMLFVDRSNAGRALKSIEQRGFVSRQTDEVDKRTKFVRITAKGLATVAKISELRTQMAESFFGELSEEQAGVIANLLKSAVVTPNERNAGHSHDSHEDAR
jgi:MarR family transcriptional regulator, transcriptional regulator for hemolysin